MRNGLSIFLSMGILNSALAAEPPMDHSTHQGGSTPTAPVVKPSAPGDHATHNAAPVPDTGAAWAYSGRANPPLSSERWEMVPVPGYGHMFISTQNLSSALVCAALNTPGIMLDRATQERCGIMRVPADAPANAGAGHSGH